MGAMGTPAATAMTVEGEVAAAATTAEVIKPMAGGLR